MGIVSRRSCRRYSRSGAFGPLGLAERAPRSLAHVTSTRFATQQSRHLGRTMGSSTGYAPLPVVGRLPPGPPAPAGAGARAVKRPKLAVLAVAVLGLVILHMASVTSEPYLLPNSSDSALDQAEPFDSLFAASRGAYSSQLMRNELYRYIYGRLEFLEIRGQLTDRYTAGVGTLASQRLC
jgi:hypothetical protein